MARRMARMSQGGSSRPGHSSHVGAPQAFLPSFPPSPPTCHFFWQAWIVSNYCLVSPGDGITAARHCAGSYVQELECVACGRLCSGLSSVRMLCGGMPAVLSFSVAASVHLWAVLRSRPPLHGARTGASCEYRPAHFKCTRVTQADHVWLRLCLLLLLVWCCAPVACFWVTARLVGSYSTEARVPLLPVTKDT